MFLERLAYLGILVLLLVLLFGWPLRYGRTVFDPAFPIASGVGDLDHCDDAQLLKGPSFVAFEGATEQTLFRLCFDKSGDRQYIEFFASGGRAVPKIGTARLSEVVQSFVKPRKQ
jgi:hypothetical protein